MRMKRKMVKKEADRFFLLFIFTFTHHHFILDQSEPEEQNM